MRKIFIVLFAIINISQSFGQIEKHVFWTFKTQKISKNQYWLIFEAKIDDKWHLYSPHNPPGGALPLRIIYDDTTSIKLLGDIIETPTPKKVWDDIFEKEEWFFEHKATFKQKIQVLSQKDFTLTGILDG